MTEADVEMLMISEVAVTTVPPNVAVQLCVLSAFHVVDISRAIVSSRASVEAIEEDVLLGLAIDPDPPALPTAIGKAVMLDTADKARPEAFVVAPEPLIAGCSSTAVADKFNCMPDAVDLGIGVVLLAANSG